MFLYSIFGFYTGADIPTKPMSQAGDQKSQYYTQTILDSAVTARWTDTISQYIPVKLYSPTTVAFSLWVADSTFEDSLKIYCNGVLQQKVKARSNEGQGTYTVAFNSPKVINPENILKVAIHVLHKTGGTKTHHVNFRPRFIMQ